MSPRHVLDFWFLPEGSAGHGGQRAEWFRKDDAFDAAIAQSFGALIDQAVAGGLHEWDQQGPRGVLARILLLDQFTRNARRGSPAAFAGDPLALGAARELVERGADAQLTAVERVFAYLPFEHAEDAAMQERSVELFSALAAGDAAFAGVLDYAHRHREVIRRFGRFPHRNPILQRASTLAEVDYLAQPGSGF